MEWKIIHIDETDSTNRYIKGLRDGNVVVADYQTSGRGCGANTWESEHGKNLLLSVMIHPSNVLASQQFILSMANALALRDSLADYVDDVKIKWPNDIYWKDCKICGTLIETTLKVNSISDCIIGTGINVNQRMFCSDAPNPVSLFQILGHEVDRQELLNKVLTNLSKYMDLLKNGSWEKIRVFYRYYLYRLEEMHSFRFDDGAVEYCKVVNVTDDGHLELLHDNREIYRLAFKEVQFII